MTPDPRPLILTARLDPASQARFDRERQSYFPAELNHIPAHVTLFHHLPGLEQPTIERHLVEACRQHAPAPFTITGLRFLGRGTAYEVAMPEAGTLRRQLAAEWRDWLPAQDRQGWRPHVTVQNKVSPAAARELHAALFAGFTPCDGLVVGLSLWRYLGGPWDLLGDYPFAETIA